MGKARILAFIQAREGSSRFPKKIYQDLNGAPLVFHTVSRAKQSRFIADAILISPERLSYVPEGVKEFVLPGFSGPDGDNDVLSEFYWCLKSNPCDYIVRLTSDCPLLDPHLIDLVIYEGVTRKADYCSNVVKLTFPDGVDTELVAADILRFLHDSVKSKYHREHVTSLLRDNADLRDEFKIVSIENTQDLSGIKISIDTPEELERVRAMERKP